MHHHITVLEKVSQEPTTILPLSSSIKTDIANDLVIEVGKHENKNDWRRPLHSATPKIIVPVAVARATRRSESSADRGRLRRDSSVMRACEARLRAAGSRLRGVMRAD